MSPGMLNLFPGPFKSVERWGYNGQHWISVGIWYEQKNTKINGLLVLTTLQIHAMQHTSKLPTLLIEEKNINLQKLKK